MEERKAEDQVSWTVHQTSGFLSFFLSLFFTESFLCPILVLIEGRTFYYSSELGKSVWSLPEDACIIGKTVLKALNSTSKRELANEVHELYSGLDQQTSEVEDNSTRELQVEVYFLFIYNLLYLCKPSIGR